MDLVVFDRCFSDILVCHTGSLEILIKDFGRVFSPKIESQSAKNVNMHAPTVP